MRKTLSASILVLVLFCSVRAGDIPTTPVVTPPPAPAGGTIHTGAAAPTPEVDGLTGIALSLLQTALTLF